VARLVQRHPDTIAVAMLTARLFGIRLANLILSPPLIGLVVLLASIDGLTERAIRRECGGHESSTKFRFSRQLIFTLMPPLIGMIYLCLPIDISLAAIMVPTVLATAILVRMKMKYFKKYL
jgi:hypothetical protein